jgi:uncharacterized membrane protein
LENASSARHWPGLGLVVTAVGILAIGALTTNVFGRRFLAKSENILQHVPLFKHVYAPVKQLISAFSPDNESGSNAWSWCRMRSAARCLVF